MKFLDPKNDILFKKIFGQHPNILMSFLNSMLPLSEGQEIVELEYLSPEMRPETYLEKFTAVDVRCKDSHGRQFLVEMQMNWTTAFKQRVLFNASRAYVIQSEKGSEFRQLKPVYALNLINQNYLPKSPDYYHHYAVIHVKDSNEKLEGLEFVFIELEKFKAQNIRDKRLQVLWLRFLTEVNEKTKEVSEELYEHEEIHQALNHSHESSLSVEEKLLYDKNWDRISSEKTILNQVREESEAKGEQIGLQKGEQIGLQKGEQIGLQKGEQIAIQKVALNAKKRGMSIKDISDLTGLSEKEIMDL